MSKSNNKHIIIPVFINNLGCPANGKCIFCNQESSGGEVSDITGSAAFVKKYIRDVFRVKVLPSSFSFEIAFYGGTFTALEKDVQTAAFASCRRAVEEELSSAPRECVFKGFRVSTRPDFIDKDRLETLAGNGVETVEIGVESFDDGVLEFSGRGYRGEVAFNAAKLIKTSGFALCVHLMCGLPYQTRRIFFADVDKAVSIAPDYARLHPLCVLRGTPAAGIFAARPELFSGDEELINQTAYALARLELSGALVIRAGILENDRFRKDVISGPSQPNLREVAESRIHSAVFDHLRRHAPGNSRFLVETADEKIKSHLIGYRKENILKNNDIILEIKNKMLYNETEAEAAYIYVSSAQRGNFIRSFTRTEVLREYIDNI